jgi:hypothetical protein
MVLAFKDVSYYVQKPGGAKGSALELQPVVGWQCFEVLMQL